MTDADGQIILGSRSPRRLELLRLIVPEERITVVPPKSEEELDFDDATDWPVIEERLMQIARSKNFDVLQQMTATDFDAVITADTVIVAPRPGVAGVDRREPPACAASGGSAALRPQPPVGFESASSNDLCVLGQPPETDDWPGVVREWFDRYLLERDHTAVSAVCVTVADGRRCERVVKTRVRFDSTAKRWLEWYLRTGEPQGKAGGYAVQGAGGLFTSEIRGSVSNVVGLPLRELLEMLEELGIVAC